MFDGTNSYQTLATYKTAVGPTRDATSISENPTWQSTIGATADFLKFNTSVATGIESGAANIATFTDDYSGTIRFGNPGSTSTGTAPDMGAWELNGIPLPLCTGTPAASIINGPAAVCYNTGTSLTLSTPYTDLGITYQWASGTTPGGPYPTILGTSATQATGNLTVATYYICTITCTNSTLFYTTAEKSVLINAIPSVTVTPTSASYCTPGGTAVALIASNAVSYTWSPTAGLSPTTGANVNASPASTTTYTVTGTDGNGCVNTAAAVITVGASVTATAIATPAAICSGSNSQLLATGIQSFTTPTPSAYGFVGSTGAYSSISGTTLTTATTDDNGVGNLPIGFSFNFNGANHTIFGMRTNGLIELDQATATLSGFSSNALASSANCIAPLWDDNNTVGGTMIYATTGPVGSRVLTAQWTAMHVGGAGSTTNPTIDMQLKLYEGSNKIEFIYGSTSAALTATSASIGISGASGNFLSVTPLSPVNASTTNSITENTSISSATNFPNGTKYTFSPTGAPAFTYAWTPPSFILGQQTLANPLATAVTSTTNYTVIVTGNAGCSATATATVTAGATLAATALANPATPVCAGTSVALTATPAGGGAPFTYSWKVGATEVSTLQSFNATPALTTIYDLTITDNCAQTATASVTVNVNPVPIAGALSNSPICSGSTLNLTGTSSIAGTYTWTGPNGFTSSSLSPGITSATTAASGTYSFIATAAGCPSAPATTSVTVYETPSAVSISPSAPAPIMAGAIQQLVASGGSLSPTILLNEDFNGAVPGWTTVNNSTGGIPADAAWGLYLSGTTFYSNDNSDFVMSNSDAQGTGGTTNTQLISPAFSTVGYTSVTLSFWHYFRYYSTADFAYVEVSTNGGTTWLPAALATYTSIQGSATGFVNVNLSMSTYANQSNIKIRFRYLSSYGYYWAIDNVSIIGTPVSAPITWSPTTGLYTDNPPTIAYDPITDPNQATVYAMPSITKTYTATATSAAGCTSSASVTVIVNQLTATWTGAVSNDWANSGNWDTDVPVSTTDVVIPAGKTNYPTLSSAGSCNNIFFGSTATSTATLLDNGFLTVNGSATVQRSFTGDPSLINDWHLVSSPVSNATANVFYGMYLQSFAEASHTYFDIEIPTTPLNAMEGYGLYSTLNTANTVSFTGNLNLGTKSRDFTADDPTTNPLLKGWNLMGNPFVSSIDWEAVTIPLGLSNEVHFIEASSHNDLSYVQGVTGQTVSQYIAPMQGFFVKATGSGTLSLGNDQRSHSGANTFYKSYNPNLVALEASGSAFSDQTLIHFNSLAGTEHDGKYDAYKLISTTNPKLPQLYSVTPNGVKLSVNGLPEITSVPVGFTSGEAGNFTIAAVKTGDFSNLSLEDTQTGIFTDLLKNSYTFSSSAANAEQRFVLHFGPLSINEAENAVAAVYANRNIVYIDLKNNVEGDIFIYNISGQLVATIPSATGSKRISLANTGNYIVKVISEKSTMVKKVFVQ